MRVRVSRLFLPSALLLWAVGLVVGWHAMLAHTYRAEPVCAAAESWPLPEMPGNESVQVVVFAHPFCPCTRASLAELEESLSQAPGDVRATVIFVTAGFSQAEIENSSTIAAVKRMSQLAPRPMNQQMDSDGELTQQFGATISGEVFVFDRAGRRVFHGGITAGRGHRGHSPAQDAFAAALRGKQPEAMKTPLFGCRLPQAADLWKAKLSLARNYTPSTAP